MKIAFDENMPATLVRVFQALAKEHGFRRHFMNVEIVSSKDYSPSLGDPDFVSKSDVPWLVRYKRDGGRIVVSGDTKMPDVPQELRAIVDGGLVAFFFPNQWNKWKFPRKSALILVWLERIIEEARASRPGSLYRIPHNWSPDAAFLRINEPTPLRLLEREHHVRPKKAIPKPTQKRKPILQQADLLESPAGLHQRE